MLAFKPPETGDALRTDLKQLILLCGELNPVAR